MMMLNKIGDSPAAGDAHQKDGILPPIGGTHRKNPVPSNDGPAGSTDDDSDGGSNARASQLLSTRWRSKPKKSPNRLETNKSSMSDSFVLPRINCSSQSNSSNQDRKSRASLTFPVRTRETSIPMSKSCPALVSNQRRRQAARDESPDQEYGYDGDFEEADNSPRDFKSLSTAEALNGRKRDGKSHQSSRHQDDITEGVVNKLAKLESPQGKANHHHRDQHWHHSKTKEPDTVLPDIFVPKGLSMRVSTQVSKEPRPNHSQANTKPQIRTEHEARVPELEPTGEANNNSYSFDTSPWKAAEIVGNDGSGTPQAAGDPLGRQSHLSQSTKGRKRRKQKKSRPTDHERPTLLRDTTQADIKCRNWLAEGHKDTIGIQLASSEQPNVT